MGDRAAGDRQTAPSPRSGRPSRAPSPASSQIPSSAASSTRRQEASWREPSARPTPLARLSSPGTGDGIPLWRGLTILVAQRCLRALAPYVLRTGANSAYVHLRVVAEFSPGLEGVVAAETAVSEVDGANGRLIYRGGYLIEDLVPVTSYEEVAFLLWRGELPNEKDLDGLRKQMAAARRLNDSARKTLAAMDPKDDPMDLLRTLVSAQGATSSLTKPTLDEAIALTAVFPTIIGGSYRRRLGKNPIEPRDDLGHAANLLWMLEGKEPEAHRVHWVDTYLVLLADHGLNASTFAARVVASTGSDLASCVVGAIAALKGPAHGGATLAARNRFEKVGSAANAEKWLTEARARPERFSGFAHR